MVCLQLLKSLPNMTHTKKSSIGGVKAEARGSSLSECTRQKRIVILALFW